MSAVGLSDLYRYGARFVGYGLLVTAAGGAFVAGGSVLGAPDIRPQVGTIEALLGIAAVAIGVLLVLSGLVGLVYKLIADAVMAGTAAALRTEAADTDVAAVDESDTEAQTDAADETTESVPADDQPTSATADSVGLFEGVEESEATDAEQTDAETSTQEWSPPDPSEFERTEPSTDAAAEGGVSSDDQDADDGEEKPDARLIDDDNDPLSDTLEEE